MDFIAPELMEYAENHTDNEPEILKELRRETWQKIIAPRMLSGHLQGRFLSIISRMLQPKSILEIGTYTGYSTLCLAEGLKKDGSIFTIDNNEELYDIQRKYFVKSGYDKQINQYVGDASKIIPTLNSSFDLVFIDADKANYSLYFDLVINNLERGGILLSDNVLWSGKVLQSDPTDIETQSIQAFNSKLVEDNRVEVILLPFRDGISIARKL